MSRFIVALLTEGRSARDLPKQHPDKKNLQSKVLPYCTWWLSASTPSFLIFLCWIPSFLFGFSPLFGHLCFCMFKLFVCKKSWYSGRVSFHRRFADCWGLCPGPTQAASEKNRRGLNTWYLFGFACWLLSSRWVPSTWSKLIQLKHYQTYRIQKIVKLLSLTCRRKNLGTPKTGPAVFVSQHTLIYLVVLGVSAALNEFIFKNCLSTVDMINCLLLAMLKLEPYLHTV